MPRWQVLGQTGDGHFSPVGGYHPELDLVLLLDVVRVPRAVSSVALRRLCRHTAPTLYLPQARFKYPPHWVPLPLLYAAMFPLDTATGTGRLGVVIKQRA